mgnify:CR=1 FL=1
MKTLREMLKPRESVYSDTAREDVLNLSDYAEGTIDAEKFFAENFRTQGMNMLFDTAFKRFKGESDISVIMIGQKQTATGFWKILRQLLIPGKNIFLEP